MKLVLFAYHDIGCCAIRTLHQMGETIAAVFTHEDNPNENVWFGSVKKCAQELGIPVYDPVNPNTSSWIKTIHSLQPDAIFSFYYRSLLSNEILSIPPKGSFNLHGSLLPKFRGRSPINWAILKGEKETGITLHTMVQKADAGEILVQKKVAIGIKDTAFTLFKKLVPLTQELLLETVPLIRSGTTVRVPQIESQATKFGGRKPEDGKIDWKWSSQEIYNLIRAVTYPYPGAFTFLAGEKVFLWWASPKKVPNNFSNGAPGEIVSLNPCLVSCKDGFLEIKKVQTENTPEQTAEEWVQSKKIQIGTKLGDSKCK